MTKRMVEIRIPGLDHSLMGDGSWAQTAATTFRNDDPNKARARPAKGKGKGLLKPDSDTIPLWEGVAP